MSTPAQIVGYTSSNRVPGYYGETVYGAGAISAASIALTVLLVGTMGASGTATSNQDIVSILSSDDADGYFQAGYELPRMCYQALRNPNATIKAGAVPEAGGAAAATCTFTFSGTWTAAGTFTFRLNGEVFQLTIGASDTIANAATNMAALINTDPRRPFTAAAGGGGGAVVTVTTKSKGARANQYIAFQDTTKLPAGCGSALAGGSGVTGGGVPFSGGSGTESCATFLTLLTTNQYDRIVTAENDSTNLGRWLTQLNTNAGPTAGLTEHLVTALNGANSAAITLANTLNSPRMQLMQYLNGETAPWEMAAYFGAYRSTAEQTDPATGYDDLPLLGVAPQSQVGDRPNNATLQSLINNGVTPVYTPNGTQALICRSVTTHTLNGSTPDYRTLDTSDAYVPDFVRRAVGLLWQTSYKPANPRVGDNPPADVKELASGLAYPDSWNAAVYKLLKDFELGILSAGGNGQGPQVPPIIINVDANLPTAAYDPAGRHITGVVPVVPAPVHHAIGVSVRNTTSV